MDVVSYDTCMVGTNIIVLKDELWTAWCAKGTTITICSSDRPSDPAPYYRHNPKIMFPFVDICYDEHIYT